MLFGGYSILKINAMFPLEILVFPYFISVYTPPALTFSAQTVLFNGIFFKLLLLYTLVDFG